MSLSRQSSKLFLCAMPIFSHAQDTPVFFLHTILPVRRIPWLYPASLLIVCAKYAR